MASNKLIQIVSKQALLLKKIKRFFPELVIEGEDGFHKVNYIGIIPHLLEAIKELKAENEQLRIDLSIQNKKRQRKARLAALEKMIAVNE